MQRQPEQHLTLMRQSAAVAPAPSNLAQALRAGTRQHHTDAERAGVMPSLLHGQLPLARYRALLRNLHAIYAALEPALGANRRHTWIVPIWSDHLHRGAALQDDLATLALRDTINGPPLPALCPTTTAYVQRLEDLAANEPGLLLAHAYVRYLGDLSGGQTLARIVAKAYGLHGDGPGTRFYNFGSADAVRALSAAWRAGLNMVPVDDALTAQLVAEAQWAFRRHQDLFVELQA